MSKIISNYSVTKDELAKDETHHSATAIIKIPVFRNEEKKIEAFDIKPQIEEPKEPKEPKLQLTRNKEGIVIGIEVQCSCGETILIKMDYK